MRGTCISEMEKDDLHRVTFHFEQEVEVRYLERIPQIGDHVSREEQPWVVDDVSMDTVGPFVICRRSPGELRIDCTGRRDHPTASGG